MGERLRASGRTESTGQLGPLSLAPDPSSHWPSTPKLSRQPQAQQGHPAPPSPSRAEVPGEKKDQVGCQARQAALRGRARGQGP